MSSSKRLHLPVFSDFVFDNFRSRALTVLGFAALFVLAVFTLVFDSVSKPTAVSQVTLVSTPTTSFFVADKLPRHPRAQVLSDNELPIEHAVVTVRPKDVSLAEIGGLFDCSTSNRVSYSGTLKGSVLDTICEVKFTHNVAKTDDVGLASFPAFSIERGPPGRYTLEFESQGITTETQVNVFTIIYDLFIVTSQPFSASLGSPISVQPKIYVVDRYGNPIAGRRVIAFVAKGPYLDLNENVITELERHELQGQRYGDLSGYISEPSDEDGIASFTDLTIVGSTSPIVYIAFIAEGAMKSWATLSQGGVIANRLKGLLPSVPRLVRGIRLDTPVCRVHIVTDPSTETVEGEPLLQQPSVRVVDSSGNPVSGRFVYALVVASPGFTYPNLLEPELPSIRLKQLHSAKAGPTDSDGMVTFEQLGFHVAGTAGEFTITFVCDGVFSKNFGPILVHSSVAAVTLGTIPSVLPFVGSDFKDAADSLSVIRVTDAEGNGIEGKSALISVVSGETRDSTVPYPARAVTASNLIDITAVQLVSGPDGFITMALQFAFIRDMDSHAASQLRLQFEVDGKQSPPSSVIAFATPPASSSCTFLNFTTPVPSVLYWNAPADPAPELVALNAAGEPVPGVTVNTYPLNDLLPNLYSHVPSKISDLTGGSGTTDANGRLRFTDFRTASSVNSSMLIQAYSDDFVCRSDVTAPFYQDIVSSATFIKGEPLVCAGPGIGTSSDCACAHRDGVHYLGEVETGQPVDFNVFVADAQGNPVPGRVAIPFLNEIPDYVAETQYNEGTAEAAISGGKLLVRFGAGSQFTGQQPYLTFRLDESTNSSGIITGTATPTLGYPGWYVFIMPFTASATTRPIAFFAKSKAATLEIVRQPGVTSGTALIGQALTVQPIIRVLDADSQPLEGYQVSSIYVNDDCDQGPALPDLVNRDLGFSNLLGLGMSNPSTSDGNAVFENLSFLDALTGCFRVGFAVVHANSTPTSVQYASTVSDPVCVRNLDRVEISVQPSAETSANALLPSPFAVSIIRPYDSPGFRVPVFGYFLLADSYRLGARFTDPNRAVLLSGNSSLISFYLTPKLLKNTVCVYYASDQSPYGCSDLKITSTANPNYGDDPAQGPLLYNATFGFDAMSWRRSFPNDQLTLRAYSALLYGAPDAFDLRRNVKPVDGSPDSADCKGPASGGVLGDCCDTDSQCASGVCHPTMRYCTVTCSVDPDCPNSLYDGTRRCSEVSPRSSCFATDSETVSSSATGRRRMEMSAASSSPWSRLLGSTPAEVEAGSAGHPAPGGQDSSSTKYCDMRVSYGWSFAPFCSTCVDGVWSGNLGPASTDTTIGNTEARLVGLVETVCSLNSFFTEKCNSDAFSSVLVDWVTNTTFLCAVSPAAERVCTYGLAAETVLNAVRFMLGLDPIGISQSVTPEISPLPKNATHEEIVKAGLAYLFYAGNTNVGPGYSAPSTRVKMAAKPASVSVAVQPPSTVGVGTLFEVSVLVTISTGAPLQRQAVSAAITKAEIGELSESVDSFVDRLSGKLPDVKDEWIAATLEAGRTVAYTDELGVARFRLRISGATDGLYTLQFNSGGKLSTKTEVFEVLNPIRSVSITENIYLDTEVEKADFPVPLRVNPPVLRLVDEFGQGVPGKANHFRVYVVNDGNSLIRPTSLDSFRKQWDREDAIDRMKMVWSLLVYGARRLSIASPVTQANVVVRSGPVIEGGSAADGTPLPNGTYRFTSLELEFATSGVYHVVFVVDSIASEPSARLYVRVKGEASTLELVKQTALTWLLFIFSCFALVGNSTWHRKHWLPVSACVCILGIILPNVAVELRSSLQYNMLMVLYPIMLVWIGWVAFSEYVQLRPDGFTNYRRAAYIAYVKSLLDGTQAARQAAEVEEWEHLYRDVVKKRAEKEAKEASKHNSNSSKKSGSLLSSWAESDSPITVYSAGNPAGSQSSSATPSGSSRPASSSRPSPHVWGATSGAEMIAWPPPETCGSCLDRSPQVTCKQCAETFCRSCANTIHRGRMSRHVLEEGVMTARLPPPNAALVRLRLDKDRFIADQRRSFVRTAKDSYASIKKTVMTSMPWHQPIPTVRGLEIDSRTQARLLDENPEAFFYPTRMVLSLVISVLATLTLFSLTIKYLSDVREAVIKADSKAIRTVFTGINSIERLFFKETDLDLFDTEVNWAFEQGYTLHNEFVSFGNALFISFWVGAMLGLAAYFTCWIVLILDARVTILEARRGRWGFDRKQVRLADASNFLGMQVSNGLLAYVIILAVSAIVATLLSWPLLIETLLSYWKTILLLVLPAILNALLGKKLIGYSIVTNSTAPIGDRIVHRRGYMLYDAAQIFITMYTGIVTAISRLAIIVVVTVFSTPRLDRTPLPAWVGRYLLLDSGHRAYQGVIAQAHEMSNPVACVFVWILVEGAKERRQAAAKAGRDMESGSGHPSAAELRRRRVRLRFQLAFTLSRYPVLQQYRWHASNTAALEKGNRPSAPGAGAGTGAGAGAGAGPGVRAARAGVGSSKNSRHADSKPHGKVSSFAAPGIVMTDSPVHRSLERNGGASRRHSSKTAVEMQPLAPPQR